MIYLKKIRMKKEKKKNSNMQNSIFQAIHFIRCTLSILYKIIKKNKTNIYI